MTLDTSLWLLMPSTTHVTVPVYLFTLYLVFMQPIRTYEEYTKVETIRMRNDSKIAWPIRLYNRNINIKQHTDTVSNKAKIPMYS